MAFQAMRKNHERFPVSDVGACQNLALRVTKLNPIIDDGQDEKPTAKDQALSFMEGFRFHQESAMAYKKAYQRWKAAIRSRDDSEIFEIKADTRVLLGTGNASVFEFGCNLNYPWGAPYISGTSLKGLVSAYLSRYGGDDWFKENKSAVKSDAQVELFGGISKSETRKKNTYVGSLIFHDAWLATWPRRNSKQEKKHGDWFDADIITPHFFKYYNGQGYPDGMESPVPIKIAALCPGLTFLICIQGPEEYRIFAREILLKALEEEGIGGKTAVGYGRFSYVQTREEENHALKNVIEKTTSVSELQALFREHKKNQDLTVFFQEALERMGFSDETRSMFQDLRPLAFLKILVEQGEIKDLKSLNQRFKAIITQIQKAVEVEGTESLKKNRDARELFNYMMTRWAGPIRESRELNIVKTLAYDWEDLGMSADDMMDTAKMAQLAWPPLETLPHYMKKHPELFDEDTMAIILDELKIDKL